MDWLRIAFRGPLCCPRRGRLAVGLLASCALPIPVGAVSYLLIVLLDSPLSGANRCGRSVRVVMYCPRCAAETLEDVKYCRACGTDISLVPLAVTGKLTRDLIPGRSDRKDEASLSKAIVNAASAAGFVFIAFCVLLFGPAGRIWWFWMFIPAFALLGAAIAEFVRYRAATRTGLPEVPSSEMINPAQGRRVPGTSLTDAIAPSSVTESTTRRLEVPSARDEEGD
jgi:hypothetical protein